MDKLAKVQLLYVLCFCRLRDGFDGGVYLFSVDMCVFVNRDDKGGRTWVY